MKIALITLRTLVCARFLFEAAQLFGAHAAGRRRTGISAGRSVQDENRGVPPCAALRCAAAHPVRRAKTQWQPSLRPAARKHSTGKRWQPAVRTPAAEEGQPHKCRSRDERPTIPRSRADRRRQRPCCATDQRTRPICGSPAAECRCRGGHLGWLLSIGDRGRSRNGAIPRWEVPAQSRKADR